MKTFAIFLLLISLSLGVNAQTDKTLTDGLSINFIYGFPSAGFGAEDEIASAQAFNSLWGFQFGNRWYLRPTNKYGFGILINWIDLAIAYKSGCQNAITGLNSSWYRTSFDLSLLTLGPVATLAINNAVALDGFYNLRPTILASGTKTTDPLGVIDDATSGYGGFGFTNTFGAAVRWKALNIGLEYVFGSVSCQGQYSGPLGDGDLPDAKLQTTSIRLILGAKF